MELYAVALIGIKVIDRKPVWAMKSDAILALDYDFAEVTANQACRQHFPESKGYSDWKYSLVAIPQNQAFNVNSEDYRVTVQRTNDELHTGVTGNTPPINNGPVQGMTIGEGNTITQNFYNS